MVLLSPKTLTLAALVLVLGPAKLSWAEDAGHADARQWLERMIQAARNLSYEGTFVYIQGQTVEAMHIIHANSPGEGERQRLVSLNGPPREVLVVDGMVVCLLPQQQVTFGGAGFKRSPFPVSLPQELDRLEAHYRFHIVGDDRTAGLDTRVIAILPLDDLRYGYRLWLDRASGMVLRSALVDENDTVIEQLMFTRLQLHPPIDKTLLSPPESVRVSTAPGAQSAGETVAQSPWTVGRLPPGFMQTVHHRYKGTVGAYPTEHILFTDGLATVSVFIERLGGAQPLLEGFSPMGAMNAFGRVLDDHQVVVVGEVPPETVAAIAQSLDYAPANGGQ